MRKGRKQVTGKNGSRVRKVKMGRGEVVVAGNRAVVEALWSNLGQENGHQEWD